MCKQITLEDFEQYRKLKAECERLQRQIEALNRRHNKAVVDSVKGSLPYFPYTPVSYKVVGFINNVPRIKQKRAMIQHKMKQARELIERLEEFLENIPKDEEHQEIRETLELYYIDGLRYCDIPEYLGLEGDGSPQMKKAQRYIKENILKEST